MTSSHKQRQLLTSLVTENRIDTAYLFHAIEPSEIDDVAQYFAKQLCCHSTPDTCEPCTSCRQFSLGTHVDIIEINEDKSIKIDHIKSLQEQIKYGPSIEKYKVVILHHCDRLTTEAANAFLKTLEEPPTNVIFILTTHHIKQILPTIQSRCLSLRFPSMSHNPEASNLPSFKEILSASLFKRLQLAEDITKYDKDILISMCYSWLNECIQMNHFQSHKRIMETIKGLTYNTNLKLQIEDLLINV